jgi:hypothetical protein
MSSQREEDTPYQQEVFDGRRIERAEEDGLVSQWHARFVSTERDVNRGQQGSQSVFRMMPDTGFPEAAEHTIMSPEPGLDRLLTALRPDVALWDPSAGGIDPALERLFQNPMPSVFPDIRAPAVD